MLRLSGKLSLLAAPALRSADSASRLNTRPPRPSQLAPRASRLPSRRGISLLEVLISMFVLLFGLMGVAAIFPVGNHYAGRGEQLDRSAALASAAFGELKSGGMLRPWNWLYADGTTIVDQAAGNAGYFRVQTAASGANPGYAFVIDPIGAADTTNVFFPFNANGGANPFANLLPATTSWPVRRITLAQPNFTKLPARVAEFAFRLHDDVSTELPRQSDRPGRQRWVVDMQGTPNNLANHRPLSRAYAGSYSWLATLVPTNVDAIAGLQPSHERYGSYLYEVSAVVFHRRDTTPSIASERLISARLLPGGELEIYGAYDDVEAASQDVRAGHWIALAGVNPANGQFLLKWYRLLSFDNETDETGTLAVRRAMIEGPNWPAPPTATTAIDNLRAIILPGVVGVTTQTIQLQAGLTDILY